MAGFRRYPFAVSTLALGLALALLLLLGSLDSAAMPRFQIGPTPTPIMPTATPVLVTGVDLQVIGVDRSQVSTSLTTAATSGNLGVTIRNGGTLNVTTPFTVSAFVDIDRNGAYAATDTTLGRLKVASLGPGANAAINIPLSGSMRFFDDTIAVVVDSPSVVAEANETNNVYKKAATCAYSPYAPLPPLAPQQKWQWTSSTTLPNSKHVQMTPAVADLNLDGSPDLIFTTFEIAAQFDGHLRAITGATGAELFTVADARYTVNPRSGVAVGNIDSDAQLEVIAVADAADTLLAFEHDGTLKWRGASASKLWPLMGGGAPAIANLDQTGAPEIIYGGTVFKSDGTILWQGTAGQGNPSDTGPLALVANLDGLDTPEVLAGNTAYRANGAIYWQKTALPDGLTAVGNFDTDDQPEIALVGNGKLYLLQHDGTTIWERTLGTTEFGGAPLVVDVNNDGTSEIGVAGERFYYVYNQDGGLRWSKAIVDNSGLSAATAFDFQGDGIPEIVHRDETTLRIWRASDGLQLYTLASSSSTWQELPIVADYDGNGFAELILASDSYLAGAKTGVQVYYNASNQWMGAPRVWNQHTYHVTNVSQDGAIPSTEASSWLRTNTYRVNPATTVTGGPAQALPDLTASRLDLDTSTAASGYYTLKARIGNGGFAPAPKGTRVVFYLGDPNSSGVVIGVANLASTLLPEQFADLSIRWNNPPPADTIGRVSVRADDPASLTECSAQNNALTAVLRSNVPPVGATLWLRSDTGVAQTNGVVSGWADISAVANHAQQSTAGKQPSLVAGALNTRPVVRFTNPQSLFLTRTLTARTFTVFVVGKNNQASESISMILGPGGPSSDNAQLRWENGTQAEIVGSNGGIPEKISTIGNTRVYHALSMRYDGTTLTVYRDGVLMDTQTFTSSGNWSLGQIAAWWTSYYGEIDLAEVLFYPTAISETDRSATNAYLRSRYALP